MASFASTPLPHSKSAAELVQSEDLNTLLSQHPDVAGASVAYCTNIAYSIPRSVHAVTGGLAKVEPFEPMTGEHYLQCASLSKTVATAFAIEYFSEQGISMRTPVNELLARINAPWRLGPPPLSDKNPSPSPQWASDVLLFHLVNHTALGMHYVYGIPVGADMPSMEQLLQGDPLAVSYGYSALHAERAPGTAFKYSGGGFIVLQYIIETMHPGQSIESITREFLNKCDMQEFSFSLDYDSIRDRDRTSSVASTTGHYASKNVALGYLTKTADKSIILRFPEFAAGATTQPKALLHFLLHLAKAFNSPSATSSSSSVSGSPKWRGSGGISHETARLMLDDSSLVDLGCMDFMRARMGLGVFVTSAGKNKIMIHQAANEGYRGVYMVCFDGPDANKGFVSLLNGDNPAVFLQCEVCRLVLRRLGVSGIDYGKFSAENKFSMVGLKQETIVNLGLKELVLSAFIQPTSRL